jgi:Fur family ferric uptake transcriptional regulator
MTRQRRAVEAALAEETGFRSAQDLHASLRAGGTSISLATVYNQLRQMVERHEVDCIRTEAGEALWRRCGAGDHHHHHLRCRSCGSVEELEAPAVERWAVELGRRSGYSELSHSVEVTGICPSCARG